MSPGRREQAVWPSVGAARALPLCASQPATMHGARGQDPALLLPRLTLLTCSLAPCSWVGNLWSGVQRTAIRRAFEWCVPRRARARLRACALGALCSPPAAGPLAAAAHTRTWPSLSPLPRSAHIQPLGTPFKMARPSHSTLCFSSLPWCFQLWRGAQHRPAVGPRRLWPALRLCGAARLGG